MDSRRVTGERVREGISDVATLEDDACWALAAVIERARRALLHPHAKVDFDRYARVASAMASVAELWNELPAEGQLLLEFWCGYNEGDEPLRRAIPRIATQMQTACSLLEDMMEKPQSELARLVVEVDSVARLAIADTPTKDRLAIAEMASELAGERRSWRTLERYLPQDIDPTIAFHGLELIAAEYRERGSFRYSMDDSAKSYSIEWLAGEGDD